MLDRIEANRAARQGGANRGGDILEAKRFQQTQKPGRTPACQPCPSGLRATDAAHRTHRAIASPPAAPPGRAHPASAPRAPGNAADRTRSPRGHRSAGGRRSARCRRRSPPGQDIAADRSPRGGRRRSDQGGRRRDHQQHQVDERDLHLIWSLIGRLRPQEAPGRHRQAADQRAGPGGSAADVSRSWRS